MVATPARGPVAVGRLAHRSETGDDCSNLSDANACAAGLGPAGASTAGVGPHAVLVAGVRPRATDSPLTAASERSLNRELLEVRGAALPLTCAAWSCSVLAVLCNVECALV